MQRRILVPGRSFAHRILRNGSAFLFTAAMAVMVCVATQWSQAAPRIEKATLNVRASRTTGLATFVTAQNGGPISVPVPPGQPIQPMDFLAAYGELFGVTDPANQLVQTKAHTDALGQVHTKFEQVHKGVPVFSGVLIVHQNAAGQVLSANGDFYPIPRALNIVPTIAVDQAVRTAKDRVGRGDPAPETAKLVIVDPGWYGDPRIGAHLAYYIILTDLTVPVREAFFIDAHTGRVLDRWTLLEAALNREIFDDYLLSFVRLEGDPPTGDYDADALYDYTGDTYDYWFRAFGRDSHDGAGGIMNATAHLQDPSSCPNAFGGGGFAWFCNDVTGDDVVAHEWGHSLMDFTAGLIYQNQSGQLNESYSDIWGEMVDLFNGDAAFAGPPGGTPWPAHPTGPGLDTPNTLRTSACVDPGAEVVVNLPAGIAGPYVSGRAAFGPPLTPTGVTADLALAEPALACSAITNPGAIAGKIAVVDRGTCFFTDKALNCQAAGAVGMLVADNVAGAPFTMGIGTLDPVTIPSLLVSLADGTTIKGTMAGETVNATLRAVPGASVRWLLCEDCYGFVGAIRDMWEPTCFGDPDRANHPFQTCNPADNGGVHSGSGIPNHAFAMLTDGKTFNGYTVAAIGPIKAAAVWYRALTVYLTPSSDFGDAYVALNQSAADLIGTSVIDPRDGSVFGTFTAADAAEVEKALRATEMNTLGLCGHSTCSTNADCDDFNFCNGVETCDAGSGACLPGTDETCKSANPCAVGVCEPFVGCVEDGTGVTGACDDGDSCTENDQCQGDAAGTCSGAPHCQLFGDVFPAEGNCAIDVDDILRVLAGFADPVTFPEADIFPCGGNSAVDVDDILSDLRAFAGDFDCPHPCPPSP